MDAGEGGNTISNITTTATGDQPDLSTAGDDLSEAVVVDDNADLVTVKVLTSGNSTPEEGEAVTFQIAVDNTGAAQATNVTLTDLLPAGLTATASNGAVSQGSYDAVTGIWTVGTLADGSGATLTLEGTVDVGEGGNTISNTTTAATGDQPDPSVGGDDLSEAVVVDDNADLVTVKALASGNNTPEEGETITFQIAVDNTGAAQATNVSLTDLLPAGLTATVSNGAVSQGSYDAVTGIWAIGTLADGASATLTLEGTVDAGEGGNTISNITTAATGDQPDPSVVGDDLSEVVVVDDNADLVTVKALASGNSTPGEGDTVTFEIAVDNAGAAQATNVSLTDLLPAGLTATANNGTVSQGSYDAVTGIWTVGTLADGGNATLTLEGTVDVGEGGKTISNITTAATGDQPDPSVVGDDLSEAVVVDPDADLVTVKALASGNSTPEEGETVTFQIAVDNAGAAQATNVSLTDLLPAGLTATANNGTVSQGSYDAVTGIWTVGTMADGGSATLTLEGTVDVGEGGNTISNITTAATGDQPDPSVVGDDLSETVVVDLDADLVTVKALASGNSTPEEGETVTFQITVDNAGAAQATNVSLTDLLPAGLTATANNGAVSQGSYDAVTGIWIMGTLADGGSATLTLEGTVDVGEGGNTISNITTAATGDQPDPSVVGDDLAETVVVDPYADLVTVKALASGDSTPEEGDTVTFQIAVGNTGAAQATNISLTDLLPAGLTATANNGTVSQGSYDAGTGIWTVGVLADGGSATLTLEGTVDAGEGGSTISNITTAATGDQPDPSVAGDDLAETVVVDPNADLVTVKALASGDSTPEEGDTVTFQIAVGNTGAAQATNVSLTDLLPAGLTATANNGTVSQGSYDAGTGIWTVGTLANGGSATLTLEGTVDVGEGGKTISNITTAATGDQPDPSVAGDDLSEAVVVDDDADLVTIKQLTSGNATPEEGDTVTFQIAVGNTGAAQATNVSLTDLLPAGLTATANNGTVSQGSYDAGTGIWTVGTLANGGSATLTLEGTVDAGEGSNTISNITTAATGDQPDPSVAGDDLSEAVVVDDDADLVTIKQLTSGNATPEEGDTVTFQIAVGNTGAAQATNVSLTDLLPAGLTATANNGTVSQGSYDAVTGVWSVGTLADGGNATLTLEGTVDAGEGGNTISNITTAAIGDQPDPSVVGDDLSEAVLVDDNADLVTVKALASGNSTPEEGEIVTFQIAVSNAGAAQATNVSLTDLLPAGLTATANNGTISQGSYDAVTGIWTVGTLADGGSATLILEGMVDAGEGGNTISNITTAAIGDQPDSEVAGDDLDESVQVINNPPVVNDPDPTAGTPSIDPLDPENILVPAIDGIPVTIDMTDYLTDPNGHPLTITAGTLPPGATYDPVTNILTFVPSVDNVGDTVIPFVVTDGFGGTTTPTITIQPVNPVPDAVDETVGTGFETPVTTDPLANDADPDGDALTIVAINGVVLTPGVTQTIALPNGSVTVSVDGTITVTPNDGFSGDIDVPYTIVDEDGDTDTAVHTVEVANAPPVVVDPNPTEGAPSIDPFDAGNILVPSVDGTPVTIDLDNYFADPNGGTLTITPGTLPPGAMFNPLTNELTFIPSADNIGHTVIPFTVTDSNGGTITPTITIQPANPAPVAENESLVTGFETPVVIDPLANDSDPDGDALTITEINGVVLIPGFAQTISVANGTVTVATDGSITVTPDSGFSGDIDVSYRIVDEDGATDSATHTVVVANAPPQISNAIPLPPPGTASIDPLDSENLLVPAVDGETITIDLDDYLTDPNGDPLTITPATLPPGATFNRVTNEVTFTPKVDNAGDTVISFTVTDSNGETIQPTITFQPVNPAPIANPDVVETPHGTAIVVDLLANDTDPDSDVLTLATAPVLLDPASGTLLQVGESWVFTPVPGFSGDAVISYVLQDQDGQTATSLHTVTVGEPQPAAGSGLPPVLSGVLPEHRATITSNRDYERTSYRPPLETELAILRMTEGLNSLNGSTMLNINNPGQLNLLDINDDDLATVTEKVYSDSAGFSSGKGYRGTISVDPTDECGRVFVDTIVRGGMLSIIARSTIDPVRSSGVVSFSLALADGQPLPDWISRIADGEYLLDRSVDLETVALKVTALRESGFELTRFIEIDTLTGQIREQQQASTYGTGFYEVLEQVTSSNEPEAETLTE